MLACAVSRRSSFWPTARNSASPARIGYGYRDLPPAARAGSPILHSEISERQYSLLRALRRISYAPHEIEDARTGCRDLADALVHRDGNQAETAMRTIFGIS